MLALTQVHLNTETDTHIFYSYLTLQSQGSSDIFYKLHTKGEMLASDHLRVLSSDDKHQSYERSESKA